VVRELSRPLALVLRRDAALPALPAAPGSVHRNRLAGLPPADADAKGLDPAGVLVPERHRQAPRPRFTRLDDVQVGVTGAGGGDPDQDLAGPRRRDLDVVEDRFLSPLHYLVREHENLR
jgi:hypothetical protein